MDLASPCPPEPATRREGWAPLASYSCSVLEISITEAASNPLWEPEGGGLT